MSSLKAARAYRVVELPPARRDMRHYLDLYLWKHSIYALLEVDVTGVLRSLDEHWAATGEACRSPVTSPSAWRAPSMRTNPYRRIPGDACTWSSSTTWTSSCRSSGMFGSAGGWGLAPAGQSLLLIVGGVARKPAVVGERVEPRDLLDLTVAFDHDVVDGAPAARFVHRLVDLIESGYGLEASHADVRAGSRR